MKFNKQKVMKVLPFVILGYAFNKVSQAFTSAAGTELGDKIMNGMDGLGEVFLNPLPSFNPIDILIGIAGGVIIKLAIYIKGKDAKKYRKGCEYGSARWGNAEDIKPYMADKFEDNVILTETERLTMDGRPKAGPKYARNKNILVIGGSGSGKTRFYVKPNLLQMHSSYVVTDPKGTVLNEVGKALKEGGYAIKVLNTINFKKSMHYNPLAYIRSEKDILKLVNTIIANTKGEGNQSGEDFWVKAERLYYSALIGYIWYEAPDDEKNLNTLIEMINASEAREDDESFENPIDKLFKELEQENPEHFAVRQYKKYKLAAGKTAKSILISCGARLAPFDIAELRELTEDDELELDTLGDKKTALFVIISDTDDTFNFIVAIMYTQLFNLLCDKADDKYGGRLPVHVRFILDEFANIGQIPKFDKLIATIRSREISASIILQAQSQLKAIYKDNADTIVGNCDTTLFLGGKEKTTLKEISEILGKETIDLYNTGESRGKEVEAESIAYTVCQHFGIDTSDYSFAYVASWGTGKDTPELKASLETIRSTASELITSISDKYLGLEKDKTQEQTTEKTEKSNIIGNTAYADIEDKQYLRLKSSTAEKVAEKLTEQNIPFSGRINGDKTTLTISKADIDSYKAIIAEVTGKAKEAPTQEQSKAEPEQDKPKTDKNIIGNVDYKSISDKQYFKLDTQTATKVAEKLTEQEIPFSGRINGDKTTLTIGKENVEKYNAVVDEIKGQTKEAPEQKKVEPEQKAPKPKKNNIIGNTAYTDIPDKSYAKLGTEKALAVADILDKQGVKFSGRTDGDKTTLTISKADMPKYKEALASVNKALSAQKTEEKSAEQTEERSKLYTQSFDYAQEHGEVKEFQASHKDNMSCLWDIKATAEIYAIEGRLDDFLKDLTEKYGTERPLYVLSRTIQEVNDMRFSPEAKQIADKFEYPDKDSIHSFTHLYVTDIKPSVIDDMVYKLNEMQQGLEKAPEIQEYTGKLPDSKITIEERNAYGYESNELLPLTAEKALEFFDNDTVSVYLLYPDGTEGQANDRSDIENHNGIFGVETDEWLRYEAFQERMDKLATEEPSKEALLLNGKECAAGIYQLKDIPENRDLHFAGAEYLDKKGITPDRDNYTLVYTFPVNPEDLQDKISFLNDVYHKFNTDHPKDFEGHSLSISDVVVIQQNGELSAHFVDSWGYKELENFGAVRENPLKAIEDTVEQNDNSFDGIINNTPTMDELEEKASRGEIVSVTDMIDAAKADKDKAKQAKQPDKKRSIRGYLKDASEKPKEQPKEKTKEKEKGVEL